MRSTISFIAGYRHGADHKAIYWLCNHPKSLDLLFSEDKTKAFVFEEELIALHTINQILLSENQFRGVPVVESLQLENPSLIIKRKLTKLEQAEAKINAFLKLFNERSNSRLVVFLTLDEKNNIIRGYGSGSKLGDEITNFLALLAIKRMKAQRLDKDTFIVTLDD